MAKSPLTSDIKGKLILLGTGTSVGVPALGCSCAVCQSENPKNKRTRAGAILGLPEGNLLIDTGPDLRLQLLREKLGIVHAVVYTHEHSDHIVGMDDLRLFQFYLGHAVPAYCNEVVKLRLHKAFDYAFTEKEQTHVGAVPAIDLRPIDFGGMKILGSKVIPIELEHGPQFQTLGFRIGNVAYCTDVSGIPPHSMDRLKGLDTLILGALRPDPHPTHFSIDEAIAVAQELQAKKTYFTHMSCRVEYEAVKAYLPDNIEPGYDGLRVELS